jgi:hypothetical protein
MTLLGWIGLLLVGGALLSFIAWFAWLSLGGRQHGHKR